MQLLLLYAGVHEGAVEHVQHDPVHVGQLLHFGPGLIDDGVLVVVVVVGQPQRAHNLLHDQVVALTLIGHVRGDADLRLCDAPGVVAEVEHAPVAGYVAGHVRGHLIQRHKVDLHVGILRAADEGDIRHRGHAQLQLHDEILYQLRVLPAGVSADVDVDAAVPAGDVALRGVCARVFHGEGAGVEHGERLRMGLVGRGGGEDLRIGGKGKHKRDAKRGTEQFLHVFFLHSFTNPLKS